MCALAEVTWPDRERDWDDLEARLRHHTDRQTALGVNYRPLGGPTPGQARARPTSSLALGRGATRLAPAWTSGQVESCASQGGAGQDGAGEVGVGEIGAGQVGVGQVGVLHFRRRETGTDSAGLGKVGAFQIGGEVCLGQVGVAEVGVAQVGLTCR